MRLPFVARSTHEELLRQREQLEARVRELEATHRRLVDSIFLANFGQQLYGSITEPPAPEEPQPSAEETAVSEIEREQMRARDRLTSIAKTRPSDLGKAMARQFRADLATRARAAHVPIAVHATPTKSAPAEVTEIFSKARTEVS